MGPATARLKSPRPSPSPSGLVQSVAIPKPGRYTYRVTARSGSPYPPAYGDQTDDDVEVHGSEVTRTSTTTARFGSDGEPLTTVQITRYRWEPDRVVVLSTETRLSGPFERTLRCERTPPTTLVPVPLRAGDLPEQSYTCAEDGQQARLRVEVGGREAAADAGGRSWEVWRIVVDETEGDPAGSEGSHTVTSLWLSPALGLPVKTSEVADASGGGQRFHAEVTLLLASAP